ncbi:MAG: hybrid sensor histidine kinase/response regulator [Spirochaetes bacterium]|nr:hybrid sensor histidine kinase/response regulator [Spirochaetota bacterium]HOE20194.1 hybrid sensor histidine kinase/response regulator [Spirochaetota bacterium]HQL42630.1 hybrid sensor histidine kinase/response regulator [Spirochaetota bacterium]
MENDQISILIVDDEEKICNRLDTVLQRQGYYTVATTQSEHAIEYLSQQPFDIIITDLNMPQNSGFQIMEYIQQAGINILIIVITGYASVDTAIQSIKLGAYDFIQKPFDIETLKLTIKRAALTVKLRKENERYVEELKKLNNLKNEFISIVSHDLRSPLATIGAYVKYLTKKEDFPEKYVRYLYIIGEITENLYNLVNELLDVSKIERGILHLNYEEVDINTVITSTIETFSTLAKEKNNEIIYIQKPENALIRIDKIKIIQVLNNLISNAIKFTENGTITIKARSNENGISIIIQDTGIGIDDELKKSILDPYTLLHTNGTRGEIGTGLGLTICKRFVELHGGSISVESEKDKGSTFTIFLPYTIT